MVDEILFLCNEPLITITNLYSAATIVKHNSVSTDMYVPDNFPKYMDSQKRLHVYKLQIPGRLSPAMYNQGIHSRGSLGDKTEFPSLCWQIYME